MKCKLFASALSSVALMAALAGCATPTIGTSFVRPPPDLVRLGETTEAQIVQRLGKPQDQAELRSDGHPLRVVTYFFGNREESAHPVDAVCMRVLVYRFSGATVVGEAFVSSCAADHTDFDERKADGITIGSTRCADVVALLGRPHARSIHPVVRTPGEEAIGYLFESLGPGPSYAPTIIREYSKKLEFTCDAGGIVRDKSFIEEGRR
jgi:outer membrane protein assembly factor BamE (lipoprotein component of BamABCDE complex)